MSNLTTKDFFQRDVVQNKLQELVGRNAASFATSVLQVVNSNSMLANADPSTVFSAACMAATLNIPINSNLGFAYIVPYNKSYKDEKNQWQKKVEAQFQLGYKGFIQLAQRSGQFQRINSCATYSEDTDETIYKRLTSFRPEPPKGQLDGYIAYFKLINGYEAHLAMSLQELEAHAKKYSQSYASGRGVWKDNFEAMAQKTVIKLLLSKQAPLSIDAPLAQAVQADQAVIRDVNGEQVFDYEDNEPTQLMVTMDVSNDPTLFSNLKQGIASGNVDKVAVLNGDAGYVLSDSQRQELMTA